jgi:hypothetical protein
MNTTERGRWEMLKRLLVIGALCIGLIGFWSIDAQAWPASSSGWGAIQNTVTVWSGWKGISNADLRPTSVKVTIFPHDVLVMFRNPGGQDGGVGVPFFFPTEVTGTQVTPQKAVKNGKWNSYITFYDEELLAMIPPADLANIAPNPQWMAYAVVVKNFDVYIQAFEDVNSTCDGLSNICYTTNFGNTGLPQSPYNAEEVVHIQGYCDLGSAPVNADSAYTCPPELTFKWEYSKIYTTCAAQFNGNCLY